MACISRMCLEYLMNVLLASRVWGLAEMLFSKLDWCVDEFLKELDRLGLAENTIVILTSDNGPVLDDGYKDQAVELVGKHRPAGPLRGWKTTMYDGGVRVPFMLRWPAMVKTRSIRRFCLSMDLLASFAGLLGQTYPDKLDSRNTLKAFLGKSKRVGKNW